jgi:hypothetical protein
MKDGRTPYSLSKYRSSGPPLCSKCLGALQPNLPLRLFESCAAMMTDVLDLLDPAERSQEFGMLRLKVEEFGIYWY